MFRRQPWLAHPHPEGEPPRVGTEVEPPQVVAEGGPALTEAEGEPPLPEYPIHDAAG